MPRINKKSTEPFCKIDGCDGLWYGGFGYCNRHYVRLKKYGDPLKETKQGWAPGDPRNPSKRSEQKAAVSARFKGTITPYETREKIRASMKLRLQEPEVRERWRQASLKKAKLSAEARKKISISHAKRPKSISCLKRKADAAFSRYIRHFYADGRGNISCFTCDVVRPIAEMDCGHFVSRRHMSTRFYERNCKPQCRHCNRYNEGRKDVFSIRLIEKYGPSILMELQEEKNKIVQFKAMDYIEIAAKYEAKLDELLKPALIEAVSEAVPSLVTG